MYYAQKRELKSLIRNYTKSIAAKLATFLPFNSLIKFSGRDCILPFYHSISDEELPHINQLYQVRSTALFEKDLDFLLKYYDPIELSELIAINKGKTKKISKPIMHLSFDDGLSSCYDTVAPILNKKGIPATFFLNSDFIDNKALMFRYKVSLCLNALNNLNTDKRVVLLKKTAQFFERKEPALAQYSESSKIDELAFLLDLDFGIYLSEMKPYMSSEQIQQLLNQGFSIGSHSKDHPLYSDLSTEEQLNQTIQSQQFIEKKFEINYRVFAFPFTDYGVKKEFFNHVFEVEKFDLCFGGAGLKTDIIQQNLQRFAMESQYNISSKKMLSTEYLYYILKMPLGKNLIRRI
jgi:peptidoglycan/xylan/chitin deacetylase (PgdA/CDA1 family)